MDNKRTHIHELRVQYYETDAMGIVHHSNYIRYFETARTEMIRSFGLPYQQMEEEGIMIPVLSVTCNFKTPSAYDELIAIECWIEKLGGASFEIGYNVTNAETGAVHATGRSKHGFTDTSLRPIPLKKVRPDIYELFNGFMTI